MNTDGIRVRLQIKTARVFLLSEQLDTKEFATCSGLHWHTPPFAREQVCYS